MSFSSSVLSVFHILFAIFVVNSIALEITFELKLRENGKICSQWVNTGNQGFSYNWYNHRECISKVALEQQNGQARICCTSVPLTTSSTTFPRECGKQKQQPLKERIVGGIHAAEKSWPWQILLRGAGSQCGGTLIDQRHVLTAAHCITSPVKSTDYKITIGLHNQESTIYMEQEIVAQNVWVHEQYDENTIQNDVAVIRLSRPVEISDSVNIICLPGADVGKEVNKTVWVSGWGLTSFGGTGSPILKQTWLHTMGNRCNIYGKARFDEEKQLCAGRYTKDSDTCQGDSGGPLMYQLNGQWFLNGVVSYGSACGENGHPGVYARVSYYLPWIRSKMAMP